MNDVWEYPEYLGTKRGYEGEQIHVPELANN